MRCTKVFVEHVVKPVLYVINRIFEVRTEVFVVIFSIPKRLNELIALPIQMFNFEMDSRDLAVILMVGQPRLNTTLNQNTHESRRQRIVMNYHMGGLTKEKGRLYIMKKLDGAGAR